MTGGRQGLGVATAAAAELEDWPTSAAVGNQRQPAVEPGVGDGHGMILPTGEGNDNRAHDRRSKGMAPAASSTARMREGVSGSRSQTMAIRMAKTELVSRNADDGAIGAWLQTQRIST